MKSFLVLLRLPRALPDSWLAIPASAAVIAMTFEIDHFPRGSMKRKVTLICLSKQPYFSIILCLLSPVPPTPISIPAP